MTRETFGDGTTVTYDYDNTGALATVTDSATGIKTTYYYDLIDRMVKYVESSSDFTHSVQYTYDQLNNLSRLVETIGDDSYTTSYTYDADNRVTQVSNGSLSQHYTYDGYGRTSQAVVKNGSASVLTKAFTFQALADGRPTAQVSALRNTAAGYNVALTYGYDNNGNITSVSDGTNVTTYAYDSANQLLRENNHAANKTWVWTYDDAGNILSRTEYNYTTAADLSGLTPTDTVVYGYTNPDWGDLLTSYDGNTITYDTIGNPLTDGTWTYTWQNGRELASMASGNTTWSYTYDANGMRKTRSNGTTTYNYLYNGSQLVQMTRGTDVLYFDHATGTVTWTDTTTDTSTVYYYVHNLQGDVIAILDSAGTAVVNYAYDAWGNLLATTGSMASTLGTLNPLTYRGYVYDRETGLYYLQSRYYNPEVGRFLNSDTLVATGQGMLGNNMFAYCLNDPVILADHNGEDATIAFSWWSGSMWWLCGVDAVLPVGDIIYVAGTLILGVYALTVADKVTTPQISLEEENEEAEPEPPDVTYPGDPAESPGEDYEWRGKQPVGGDKGAWVNKTTGEQWHPDLNHKPPKGPHWDYTDIFGVVWSIFEDGRILIWR